MDKHQIQWKDITMEEEELFRGYYRKEQSNSCEKTFANNILWAPFYNVRYAVVEGALVFLSAGSHSVSFPLGKKNVKEAMEYLLLYFKEIGKDFRMHLITEEQFMQLEELFPGHFQIEYDRDAADYIYESEKLITLSGKKLHSKRNHINKFKEEHPDWSYEPIDAGNKADCLKMAEEWCILNGCEDDPDKERESCVTRNALQRMEELKLAGGLLRIDGRVIAFALGEPCNHDTYVVHVEKAYADIQGAYPMINQQFAGHEAADYRYINREEDTGAEGLRKAKLSYHPAFLLEKGIVTLK